MTGQMQRQSRYDWEALGQLYSEGNYTMSDIALITGASTGNISKALKRLTIETRGHTFHKSVAKSPEVFSSKLVMLINRTPKLYERIKLFYNDVLMLNYLIELEDQKIRGLNQLEMAKAYLYGYYKISLANTHEQQFKQLLQKANQRNAIILAKGYSRYRLTKDHESNSKKLTVLYNQRIDWFRNTSIY